MRYLFFILSTFLLISCEKEADIETPSSTPKLVIHSFICPDDTIVKVHVSTTRNIFGLLNDYPKDIAASIVMFDGEEAVEFYPMYEEGFWFSKHKIMAGKEYKLVVKCPGYPDVTATCKVPQIRTLDVEIDTTSEFVKYEFFDPNFPQSQSDYNGFFAQKIVVKFSDMAGEANFYNVLAYTSIEKYNGTETQVLYPQAREGEDYYNGPISYKVFTDKLRDGSDFLCSFKNVYFNNDTSQYAININALVLETDAAYYQYHSSLNNYSGTDEPFTEFSPIYSNIQGGMGVFASYVKYLNVLKLK